MGNSCTGNSKKNGAMVSEPEADHPLMKRSQVAKHNTPEDCWIIIDNIVYNVSEYWKVHPGGGDYVKKWAGKDATLAYREFNHSNFAEQQLKTLGAEVGIIVDDMEEFDPKTYMETPLPQKVADIENFAETGDMMCFQCQQTVNGEGCTDVGVCGKSPTISALQDLIVHYLKGLSQYVILVDQKHWDNALIHIFLHCYFMTLTNVNFNEKKHWVHIKELAQTRDKYRALYEQATPADQRDQYLTDVTSPSNFVYKDDEQYLFTEARKVGIMTRKRLLNPDLFGLIEMCAYGMKGACAYMYHAEGIRNNTEGVYDEKQRYEVMKELFEVSAGMTEQTPTLASLLGINMGAGKANFTVMDMLDRGHTIAFGKPTPAPVNRSPVEGKCILVSGHDMMVMKRILEQTAGKGIQVYTHGEMLPAFGYPELKKHAHMAGNFGTAWFNQTNEFPDFPGAILLNSNCLIQPQPSYAKRIFTTHIVGWDDVKHIEGNDYSELIEAALKLPGFKANTRQFKKYQNIEPEMTGYGHATMVELLVPEIKAGNLTEIYLVGGCDNLDPKRQRYLELMLELPKTAIVLTLGCAKFRLFGHKEEMGFLPGGNKVPRLIDVGQCNDAYSAVKVALALTEVLGVGVNELPLHLVLSWVEQKAVIILLTLLHLGIQNINIGPNLPGFLTPNLVNYLIENFKLAVMAAPKQIRKLVGQQQALKNSDKQVATFAEIQPYHTVKLGSKKEIAENTYQLNFQFMNVNSTYNLKAGQHVIFRAKTTDGEWVSRAYTPISLPGNKGCFEVIVKVYPEGLFSNHLKNLSEGEFIDVQGPCGSSLFVQEGNNVKLISEDLKFENLKRINMVAGGTSVVSMFQMFQEIVVKNIDVEAKLIVANSRENLKVLEKEFNDLKNQFKWDKSKLDIVYITSDKEGRIDQEKLTKLFGESQVQECVHIVAGPVTFRAAAHEILENMKFDSKKVVDFF